MLYIPSDRKTSKWCPTSIVFLFQSHNTNTAIYNHNTPDTEDQKCDVDTRGRERSPKWITTTSPQTASPATFCCAHYEAKHDVKEELGY